MNDLTKNTRSLLSSTSFFACVIGLFLLHSSLFAQNNIVITNLNESNTTPQATHEACQSVRLLPGKGSYKFHTDNQDTKTLRCFINPDPGGCDVNYYQGNSGRNIVTNVPVGPLNKGEEVGTTAGSFNVTETGTAVYNVPLQVSPGTMGMQPVLSVNYSSQGNNGIMGLRWALSGLSSITRTSQNLYYDANVAPVRMSGGTGAQSDRFTLDGARLMPVSTGSTYGAVGTTYETEAQSFSSILSVGGTDGNPDHFVVTTKSGTVMEYGQQLTSPNSYVKFSSGTNVPAMAWLLDKVTDIYGNTMKFYYLQDDKGVRPDHIDYTYDASGNAYNTVKFIYNGNRIDPQVNYIAGFPLFTKTLLVGAEMYTGGGNVLAHSYRFNYTEDPTTGSHLSEIIEAGSNGKQYNSTKIEWSMSSDASASSTPNYTFNTSKDFGSYTGFYTTASEQTITGDYNGDGFSDLIIFSDLNAIFSQFNYVSVVLNDGKGNFMSGAPLTASWPQNIFTGGYVQNPRNISIDLNGDGLEDFIVTGVNDKGQDVYIPFMAQLNGGHATAYNGSGNPVSSVADVSFVQLTAIIGTTNGHGHAVYGDFDGNGTTDLAFYDDLNNKIGFAGFVGNTITGPLFTPATIGTNLVSFNNTVSSLTFYPSVMLNAVDADGDGKDELLFTQGDYYISKTGTNVTGNYSVLYDLQIPSSLSQSSSIDVQQVGDVSPYPNSKDKVWSTGDFNGDGKTDLLTFNSTNNNWEIFYPNFTSHGISYNTPSTTPITGTGASSNPFTNQSTTAVVGDFNGDGKSDISIIQQSVSSKTFTSGTGGTLYDSKNTSLTYYSLGGNVFSESNYLPMQTGLNNDDGNVYQGSPLINDFNGDGQQDLFMSRIDLKNDFTFFNSGASVINTPVSNYGRVTGITNGLNATISVNYKTLPELANSSKYSKANTAHNCSCNSIDVQTPISVVSIVNTDDGLGTGGQNLKQYSYSGAQYHLQGKGFLGFLGTTVEDVSRNITVNNTYFPFTPSGFFQLLLQTKNTYTGSGIVDSKSYTYKFDQNFLSIAPLCNNTYVSQLLDHDLLHGNSSTTSSTEDEKGNATQVIQDDGAGHVSTTTNVYDNTSYAIPVLLSSTSGRTGYNGTYSHVTVYDNFNSVAQPQRIDVDNGKSTTALTYHSFGPVESSTTTGDQVAASPNSSNTYDPLGRFVVSQKTTVNGHDLLTSATYDDLYGNVLTQTDVNRLVSRFTYDGFGRLAETVSPTGEKTDVNYSWVQGNVPVNFLYQVTTAQEGVAPVTTFYDELMRSVRKQTLGFDGKTFTNVDQVYNSIGETVKTSEPYYAGNQVIYSTFTYDENFRTKSINKPSGELINYLYNGNTMATYINSGSGTKVTSKTVDASGMLISSSETNETGGQVGPGTSPTLTYTYHNSLQPATVLNNTTNSQVVIQYDNIGRKISYTDPNSGQTSFTYDGLNRVLSQTDQKGNTHTMTYDELGRMLTNSGPEGLITYTYDNKANGKGMLGSISVPSGGSLTGNQDFTFDEFSRVKTQTQSTLNTDDNKSYTTSYSYDNLNRVVKMSYPNAYGSQPFSIQNTYTDQGYLQKVSNASDNSVIWQCTAYTEYNQVLSAVLGSGGTVTKTYSSDGLSTLKEVKTAQPSVSGALSNVFDYSYNFDASNGNLLSRKDNMRNLSESFSYDYLDQLGTVTLSTPMGTGTSLSMGYAISGNVTMKSDAGSTFDYQGAQPNAVTGVESPTAAMPSSPQTVSYNPFLMASNISQGTGSSVYSIDYTYGPDHMRKYSVLKSNGNVQKTVVYAGSYEKVTVGSMVYEVHYIPTPDGVPAVSVRTNNSRDHIYYLQADHLGSVMNVYDPAAKRIIYEQSFDSWGRLRDPNNSWAYGTPANALPWLIRGYTGHEMLPEVGLINMNARLYDPLLGRMLSPDQVLSSPAEPQAYNMYTYCSNNPLKFTDPTGYQQGNPNSSTPSIIAAEKRADYSNMMWALYGTDVGRTPYGFGFGSHGGGVPSVSIDGGAIPANNETGSLLSGILGVGNLLNSNVTDISILGTAFNPGFSGLGGLPLGTWSVQNGRVGYYQTSRIWEGNNYVEDGVDYVSGHFNTTSTYVPISSNNGNSISNFFSKIWYSDFARSIIPDMFGVNLNLVATEGAGIGIHLSLNVFTRGKDAGIHATITPSVRVGFENGMSLSGSVARFNGDAHNATYYSYLGNSADISFGGLIEGASGFMSYSPQSLTTPAWVGGSYSIGPDVGASSGVGYTYDLWSPKFFK